MAHSFWKFAVDSALKLSSGYGLADSAPLLEKKWNALALALISNGENPFLFHRSSAGAALAAHDDPMNTVEIYRAKVFQQRLDREKTDLRIRGTEMIDSRKAVPPILHAYTPPDVRLTRGKAEARIEKIMQAL